MSQSAVVTALNIFPVKSCRGIALNELVMTATGPAFDRQWMIVDEQNQFLTLRTFARLAVIKTSLQGPFLHLYAGSNKILVNHTENCETTESVTVWGETVAAGVENRSINEALSDFLQKSVKLVRFQESSLRNQKQMFADSRPVLLTNENSLADLNSKLYAKGVAPSLMERYRANIVVKGLSAYAEDKIVECRLGEVILQNPHLCGRCPIITQDVESGKVVSKETLITLAEYRKSEGSRSIPFGVHFTPGSKGTIRIGDELKIL